MLKALYAIRMGWAAWSDIEADFGDDDDGGDEPPMQDPARFEFKC